MVATWYLYPTGADGDVATAANTGSSYTPVITGGTLNISTAHPIFGTRSLYMQSTVTSGGAFLGRSGMSTTGISVGFFFTPDVAPAGSSLPIAWFGTASRLSSLDWNIDRTLSIRDSPFASKWAATTKSTTALTIGTDYYISFYAKQSATVGELRCAIYTRAGTLIEDSTLLINQNTGAAAYTDTRLGIKAAAGTGTGKAYQGGWGYDPVATGLLPIYNSNTAPTANAGPDQVKLPGTVCTLTGLGSTDPEANALTYAWTPPAGITLSSNTTSSPTFTVPYSMTTQNYSISLVVTDTGGLNSASDIVVISAAAHPEWYHNGTTWKAEIITNL